MRYDLTDWLFYPAVHLAVGNANFCGFALLPGEAAGGAYGVAEFSGLHNLCRGEPCSPASTDYHRVIESSLLPFGLQASTARPYTDWLLAMVRIHSRSGAAVSTTVRTNG